MRSCRLCFVTNDNIGRAGVQIMQTRQTSLQVQKQRSAKIHLKTLREILRFHHRRIVRVFSLYM